MKKFLTTIVFSLCLSTSMASCSIDDEPYSKLPADTPDGEDGNQPVMSEKIIIWIDDTSFTATSQDNATARAFRTLVPFSGIMNEHGGNEKYLTLPQPLPTNAFVPGIIQTGDLMLWGSDCLVLFYQTFSSPYSYTKIGTVDNPSGLQAVIGQGKAAISFEHSNHHKELK